MPAPGTETRQAHQHTLFIYFSVSRSNRGGRASTSENVHAFHVVLSKSAFSFLFFKYLLSVWIFGEGPLGNGVVGTSGS